MISLGLDQILKIWLLERLQKLFLVTSLRFTDAKVNTQEIMKWQDTMVFRLQTLIGNKTWEIVLGPNGVKRVGCMWVDKRKS